MSYEQCLKLAGAEILDSESFGDYQGTSLAEVKYEGKKYLVKWQFGSCSGCDWFEAEFSGCGHHVDDDWHDYYNLKEGCEECEKLKNKLAKFGQNILNDPFDLDDLIKKAQDDAEWDFEAEAMLEWLLNKQSNEYLFILRSGTNSGWLSMYSYPDTNQPLMTSSRLSALKVPFHQAVDIRNAINNSGYHCVIELSDDQENDLAPPSNTPPSRYF